MLSLLVLTYYFIYFYNFFFVFFVYSRATPTAYGDSQARGLIEVLDAGLHQSHSNAGSELMATSDP